MNSPMEIRTLFPVRKSKKQKERFREDVRIYAEELGYRTTTESGSFGVKNVVIGDSEKADYVVTAHYDTCARLPFPNLITPCSLPLFLAWQILLTALLCGAAGFLGAMIARLLQMPELSFLLAYALLLLELFWMLLGPANRHNDNDNTSGVVAVLETARVLPVELRDRVCFVLFDLEEAGLLGSAAYRKLHRSATNRQLIINLDCVGEGDELVLFPSAKLKKNTDRISALRACCVDRNQKTICLRDRGFAVYPSDQSNFPHALGAAAFCRSKWAGLYLAKIHTPRDTNLDENNVLLLRDYIIAVLQEQA